MRVFLPSQGDPVTAPLRVAAPNPNFARNAELREALFAAHPNAHVREDPAATSYMTEDAFIAFLQETNAEAVIVGLEPMTERVLNAVPSLKVVSKFGAGCDTVDFDALQRHGVRFGYTAGVNKIDVAELAICFIIAGLRHVIPMNVAMRSGARPRAETGRRLNKRVVGIHGCGNIGKVLVRLLQPFECEILVHDIVDYADFYAEYGVTPVSFDELLTRSEVLTLHLPKTKRTLGLYDEAALAKLRPDCLLVNTCRGGIVDERALKARLKSGALYAACFDVFDPEPPQDQELIDLPNFLATPHMGAATDVSRTAMGQAAIRGLTENIVLAPGQFF
jgi:D-3-phosphoglycerate dehydrogenase